MSLFCPDCRQTYDDLTLRVCPNDGTRLYVLESKDVDDPLVGATIDGRFQIERSIGVGGMGTVYRARQLSVGRDVAVKVLRAELSGKEVALERFFREAKTISNLSHPNIVRLIDFGQDRDFDVLFLAMELVNGENLGDMLRKGRLRVALALEIAYQVCGALTEPHAAGVIHRDLKPDNLLLTAVSDGTIQTKVLDFGIARALETNESTLTATGMICGTPAYMAPEQAQNHDLGPRTDLYALGVILYEMLSGWPPFSGTSSLQIMMKHIQEVPTSLRELLPPATLPEEVEELVYSLMNKDASKRPESARAVRDRIDELRAVYDFGRVRLEESGKMDEFVLRKLPRGEENASGPTEVLRRETGMEEMLTGHRTGSLEFNSDTVDEMDHHTTFPFTPDEKGEVRADARVPEGVVSGKVKVSTKGGAQQAWTPGDQASVPRPKNTDKNFANDSVDVFGRTEAESRPSTDAQPVSTDAKSPRKTLVEDGLGSGPNTEPPEDPADSRGAPSPRAATPPPAERSPADTSDARVAVNANRAKDGVSLPLILVAAAMTLFVAGLSIVVVMEIRSLKEAEGANAATTPVETTPVETTPALPEGSKESAIERGASWAGFIAATGRHVSEKMAEVDDSGEPGGATGKKSKRPSGTRDSSTKSSTARAGGKTSGGNASGSKESGGKKSGEPTSSETTEPKKSRLERLLEAEKLTNPD